MNKPIKTETNEAILRRIADDPSFISERPYIAPSNGHKFAPGDTCILKDLVNFPEFNGDTVIIAAIREDGPNCKAYYIDGTINRYINWIYETRLTKQ